MQLHIRRKGEVAHIPMVFAQQGLGRCAGGRAQDLESPLQILEAPSLELSPKERGKLANRLITSLREDQRFLA